LRRQFRGTCHSESSRGISRCLDYHLVLVRTFLTADWRYIAILNYVVDPNLITPLAPPGTEIDYENGETFISIVGFLFLDTRLHGLPIPTASRLRRSEPALLSEEKIGGHLGTRCSFRARACASPRDCPRGSRIFGGRYFALPMKHNIEDVDARLSVEYCLATPEKLGISQDEPIRWENLSASTERQKPGNPDQGSE
jgi:uncharacterized protein